MLELSESLDSVVLLLSLELELFASSSQGAFDQLYARDSQDTYEIGLGYIPSKEKRIYRHNINLWYLTSYLSCTGLCSILIHIHA